MLADRPTRWTPAHARFPTALDPADVLTQRGPAALLAALEAARPLGEVLLEERLANLDPATAFAEAAPILAARRPQDWQAGLELLGERLHAGEDITRQVLRDAVEAWDTDPRKHAAAQLAKTRDVRARLEEVADQPLVQRWAGLAFEVDPRLVDQPDWPATATMLQEAHHAGYDVAAVVRAMMAGASLGASPARDLRYRVATTLDVGADVDESLPPLTEEQRVPGSKGAQEARRAQGIQPDRPHPGKRR